jgi:uncharacterized membrane protein
MYRAQTNELAGSLCDYHSSITLFHGSAQKYMLKMVGMETDLLATAFWLPNLQENASFFMSSHLMTRIYVTNTRTNDSTKHK